MNKYKTPDGKHLDLAKDAFADLSGVNELISGEPILGESGPAASVQVSPAMLNAHANGQGSQFDGKVKEALANNPQLRRIYRKFLDQGSAYYVPEAMAASSEAFLERSGKGCRIRMEQSRAQSEQVYVIVELEEAQGGAPSALVICDTDLSCTTFELPAFRGGIAQLIAERESELVKLLNNPKTEAFLR